MHENLMDIGEIYDFAWINCLSCFNCLGPISAYQTGSFQ